MFNLLKTAVYAAVCCLAVGATAQAQYTYSYPSYYYPTYNQNDPGYEMDFDSQTGTLTISGTTNDDICTVDMPYGNYISVNLKQVSGNTTTDLDTMYFFTTNSSRSFLKETTETTTSVLPRSESSCLLQRKNLRKGF